MNSVSGSNQVFFTLPFTAAANTSGTKDAESVSIVGAYSVDLTSNAVQVYGKQEGNSASLFVYMDFDNAANAILTNAGLSSSSFLSINHSFKTA